MEKMANDSRNGYESIGQRLFKCMQAGEGSIGQVNATTGEQDTFGDMLTRTIRTAIKLQALGFGKGDMISTCSYNHFISCTPLLASLMIGAIPSTFDPNLPELDTISLLKLIQPKIIFVSKESLEFMERCLKRANIETEIVVFGHHTGYTPFDEFLEPSLEKERSFAPSPCSDPKETAAILFSSGTTGNPKGICLTHRSLLNPYLFEKFNETGNNSEEVLLAYSTLYWISGLVVFIKSIIFHQRRILCSKFEPSNFWTIIENYKVTVTFMPPYLMTDCFQCKPPNVNTSSVKLLLTGGSPLTKKLMGEMKEAFPNSKIVNGYGMTESAGMISIFDPRKAEEIEMQLRKPNSVGRICHYIQWKLVDSATGCVFGPNQRGELLIKSDMFMSGYYNIDNSAFYDHEGFLRTGDIAYYDEENCLYIEDRVKEMFKYKGWHVIPSIIEEVLMSHPAVKEAVVIGVPHDLDGDRPMGLVVLKDNSLNVSSEQILEFVNNNVSDAQKLRAGLKILSENLPRTATGKLQRAVIKETVLKNVKVTP